MEIGAGTAALAAAGGIGTGLFTYNRSNYQMDQKLHFSRFTGCLNMAIAQQGMFRQDIQDLTSLTVTRMDVYHVVAAMGLTILTAVYCPGRTGLHTPAPPSWMMGLEFVNIAGAYLWFVLTIWYALHAPMRADAGCTQMLTRHSRLPIPSQMALDKARKFLSSYEEQPLKEVFRVPFLPHQLGGTGAKSGNADLDPDAARRARGGGDVPAWYHMERDVDQAPIQSRMPGVSSGSCVPDHFEVYRAIQEEWMSYDAYGRITLFLAFMHLTSCWTFQQINHGFQETRALFAVGMVVVSMVTLENMILTLDVVSRYYGPLLRIGPLALIFGYAGSVCEYWRWYNTVVQILGFVFAYLAHVCQIIFTLGLLYVCSPTGKKETKHYASDLWWPKTWRLPAAFAPTLWVVAPPQALSSGENDILAELRGDALSSGEIPSAIPDGGGAQSRGGSSTEESLAAKRKDVHEALGHQGESPAWPFVKTGLLAMLCAWLLLVGGFTVDVLYQGTTTPSLLSAPGLPNHARDPRYRPAKPGLLEPTEVGTGGVEAGPARGIPLEGEDGGRRLCEDPDVVERLRVVLLGPLGKDAAAVILRALPLLNNLANYGLTTLLPRGSKDAGAGPFASETSLPLAAAVDWPLLFEARVLTCDPQALTVLSSYGRGVRQWVDHRGEKQTEQFVLAGLSNRGPVRAVSSDEKGLLLVTVTGDLFECDSQSRVNGRWSCSLLQDALLPLGVGGSPFQGALAVTRAKVEHGAFRAAVAFPGDGTLTLLWRAPFSTSPWLPSGEVRLPGKFPAGLSFVSNADALLITEADGTVSHLNLTTGVAHLAAVPPSGSEDRVWSSSCSHGSLLAQLTMPKTNRLQSVGPSLLLSRAL